LIGDEIGTEIVIAVVTEQGRDAFPLGLQLDDIEILSFVEDTIADRGIDQ